MKPLILAHKGGDCFGPENSLEAIKKSLKHKPDIIEIDVRKSKDGVLFCYHGNFIENMFSRLFFRKKFSELKQKYPSLATLKEISNLTKDKGIFFLDIKDKSITSKDIRKNVKNKNVYIATQSLDYLRNLNLPKEWKKVCNCGVFRLKPRLNEVLESGIHAIELFHWDFNDKNIRLLKENGIETALGVWFLSRKAYINRCFSKKALWVSDYEFAKLKR